jgi:hypothetical protein
VRNIPGSSEDTEGLWRPERSEVLEELREIDRGGGESGLPNERTDVLSGEDIQFERLGSGEIVVVYFVDGHSGS